MPTRFAKAIHVPGTLAADLNIRFTAPTDCTLIHVSTVGSNENDAEIKIGTSADDDGFLELKDIGEQNVPITFSRADFDGALLSDPGNEFPRIRAGDVVVVTVIYGDVKGTAADDVTLVLTFLEG